MPWDEFGHFWGITPWRLVVLGITVILVRRLPWVLLLVCVAKSLLIPAVPLDPSSSILERRGLCRLLWSYW